MAKQTISTQLPSEPLEQRISRAADQVRRTLSNVIAELPVQVQKPSEFQRVLKLDRSLSSRILRAIQLQDPLASLDRLPGPHGIRLLLKAAAKHMDGVEKITLAEKALLDLEHLVVSELGDWKELDAALCGWLPDAREQFEMVNRQGAFKSMCGIRGIMAETELSITMLYPSQERPGWIDRSCITGLLRMKRLRPGAPMGLLHGHSIAPPPGVQRKSLDGHQIGHAHEPGLLREFSTQPTPRFNVVEEGNTVHYLLHGEGVGVDSMVDLLFADVTVGRYPVHQGISPQPASPGAVIDVPVKTLIVDVLVHQDVWAGVEPELRTYDTAGRGLANPLDSSRNIDRRDVLESVQSMGSQISRFRTKEVARYQEMLQFVCGKLGWNTEKFRGFRCRIEYPVYGYHVMLMFQTPPAPTS